MYTRLVVAPRRFARSYATGFPHKNKKIAVVLCTHLLSHKSHKTAGSGVYDGSEIHEAVSTLIAISQTGATYQCFAPDIDQVCSGVLCNNLLSFML